MSCNCPTAPLLSGPGSANLEKLSDGIVLQVIDWCASLPAGAIIAGESWSVTPDTPLLPLTVTPQAPSGTQTSSLISGGNPGQLYRVDASVITSPPPSGPAQQFDFTLWVYIPQQYAPPVFVPCP